jgi:hypothetical protein
MLRINKKDLDWTWTGKRECWVAVSVADGGGMVHPVDAHTAVL